MIAAREARKQEAIARRAAKAANGEGNELADTPALGSNIPRQSWIPRKPPSPPPWHGPRPRRPPRRKVTGRWSQ
jgi:hypothetical protein